MSLVNIQKKRCYPEILEHIIKRWDKFLEGSYNRPVFDYSVDKCVLEGFLHRYESPNTIVIPKENGKALVLSYIYSNNLRYLPSLSVVKFFNKLKEQLPDLNHIEERYSVEYDEYIPKGVALLSLVEITINSNLREKIEHPSDIGSSNVLITNMPEFDMSTFKQQDICLSITDGHSSNHRVKKYSKVTIYY